MYFSVVLGLNYRCSLNIHALQSQGKTLTIYLTLRTYLSTIICFGCSFSNTPDSEKAFHATQRSGQSPCTAKVIKCHNGFACCCFIWHLVDLQDIIKTC